jgi:4-hydroxybenzoate polyprenyltransferase
MTYFKLLRVNQYPKNLFIFLPLFFAIRIFELDLLAKAAIAFIGFCLVASSVYIINDYRDRIDDANHPYKKFRPIASGKVSPQSALIIMVLLLTLGFVIEGAVGVDVLLLASAYFVLNLLYSFGLKRIAIVDVLVISVGFTLRIFIGGFATGISVQPWIVVMTFLLTLFMALAKRRDDIFLGKEAGKQLRKSIEGYSLKMLEYSMVVMASVILVSYLMYTLSVEIETKFHTTNLYYTTLFVLLGIMRYMQITFVDQKSGSPSEIFLKDRLIQIALVGWIALFGVLIYL